MGIAVIGFFKLAVKRDRVVVVQMAIDLVHLIAYGLQCLRIAFQRHDWLQQVGIELAPLDHAAEAVTAASLEWWLRVFIMERVFRLVPRAPKYVAFSAISFIPGPFLDVASHVVCAIRSQATGASDSRRSLASKITESQNL